MTVEQLYYFLEENLENGKIDNETEIRYAHQPNWPFEYSIDNIVISDGTVYLGEDQQEGYLPNQAAIELGWSDEDDE